jgi:hypothetical protein
MSAECDGPTDRRITHHQPQQLPTPPPPFPNTHTHQTLNGLPSTTEGNTAGDKILGKAAALSIAAGSGNVDGACRVANAEELREAVTVRALCVCVRLAVTTPRVLGLLEHRASRSIGPAASRPG